MTHCHSLCKRTCTWPRQTRRSSQAAHTVWQMEDQVSPIRAPHLRNLSGSVLCQRLQIILLCSFVFPLVNLKTKGVNYALTFRLFKFHHVMKPRSAFRQLYSHAKLKSIYLSHSKHMISSTTGNSSMSERQIQGFPWLQESWREFPPFSSHLFLLLPQAVPHGGHYLRNLSECSVGILSLNSCLRVPEEQSVGRDGFLGLVGVFLLLPLLPTSSSSFPSNSRRDAGGGGRERGLGQGGIQGDDAGRDRQGDRRFHQDALIGGEQSDACENKDIKYFSKTLKEDESS